MAKKGFLPSETRTLALIGHRSSGKTSLGGVLLSAAGVTRSIGRVDEQASLLDHTDESRRRRLTLEPSVAWLPWQGGVIHMVDTPGAVGLRHVVDVVLGQVDGAVLVVSCPDGIEQGTRDALMAAQRWNLPLVAVLNKLDRAQGDVRQRVAEIGEATGMVPVLLQIPFKDDEGRLAGVIDLVHDVALRFDSEGEGRYSPEPIPTRLRDAVQSAKDRAVEALAMVDDDLLERYLEFLEVSSEDLVESLILGVQEQRVVPVYLVSAELGIGAQPLLDALSLVMPSPIDRLAVHATSEDGARIPLDPEGPLVATVITASVDAAGAPYHVLRVWAGTLKPGSGLVNGATGVASRVHKFFQIRGPRRSAAHSLGPGSLVATWDALQARPGDTLTSRAKLELRRSFMRPPMASVLLQTERPQDEPQLEKALKVLTQLDHGINLSTCEVTGHWVMAGRSALHLERDVAWANRRLGVRVHPSVPPVPYRERPMGAVQGVEGLHARGDEGIYEQYARVVIDLSPIDDGREMVVIDARDDEAFPEGFLSAARQGFHDALGRGPVAGFAVHGVCVTVVGGQYDIFVSDDAQFRLAARNALEAALVVAGTQVIEPWCDLVVRAPSTAVGAVLKELGSQRSIIRGMEVEGLESRISASCPVRLIRGFDGRLDALTGGRGWFTTHPTDYRAIPQRALHLALSSSPFRHETQMGINRAATPQPQASRAGHLGKVGK